MCLVLPKTTIRSFFAQMDVTTITPFFHFFHFLVENKEISFRLFSPWYHTLCFSKTQIGKLIFIGFSLG